MYEILVSTRIARVRHVNLMLSQVECVLSECPSHFRSFRTLLHILLVTSTLHVFHLIIWSIHTLFDAIVNSPQMNARPTGRCNIATTGSDLHRLKSFSSVEKKSIKTIHFMVKIIEHFC